MLSIDFILLHWPWLQLDGVHLVYLTCVASMKICVCNFLHDIPTSLEVLRVYSIISIYIQVVGERMHAVCKDSLESMVSENARNFLSWSRSCVFQISSMQYTLLARTVCICEHDKTRPYGFYDGTHLFPWMDVSASSSFPTWFCTITIAYITSNERLIQYRDLRAAQEEKTGGNMVYTKSYSSSVQQGRRYWLVQQLRN